MEIQFFVNRIRTSIETETYFKANQMGNQQSKELSLEVVLRVRPAREKMLNRCTDGVREDDVINCEEVCCGEIVTRGQAYRLTFSTASATAEGGGCAFSELSPPTNSPCQPLTVFIPRTLDVQAAVSSSCSFRSYDDDYDDEDDDDDDNDAEDAVAAKAVKEKEKTAISITLDGWYGIHRTLYGLDIFSDRHICSIKIYYKTIKKMPGRRPTKHRDFNFNNNTAPLEEEQEWNAARCLYLNQEAKQFESPAIIREFTHSEKVKLAKCRTLLSFIIDIIDDDDDDDDDDDET
uniref:Uncharacterized protein n=1 Tax=Vespula pensylvanica TaxID=30213 RepID=A0A834P5I5_VESPE|nr:hypothetical protein H0235_005782 [Vespula pensylvanica]